MNRRRILLGLKVMNRRRVRPGLKALKRRRALLIAPLIAVGLVSLGYALARPWDTALKNYKVEQKVTSPASEMRPVEMTPKTFNADRNIEPVSNELPKQVDGDQPALKQFASETFAKAYCPGETVVWANAKSKVYHVAGSQNYGHTKGGAYMCEKDSTDAGFQPAALRQKLTNSSGKSRKKVSRKRFASAHSCTCSQSFFD
jgi:hypothetical protein